MISFQILKTYKFAIIGLFCFTMVVISRFRNTPFQNQKYCTLLNSNDGELIGVALAADEQWRFAPADSFPKRFEIALLTFEDKWFYKHFGINPFSIIRAVNINLKAKKIKSGGSTISMQLARMLYPNKARTYWQKIKEIYITIKLELSFSKNEILKMYINNAPFGGNIVGLEAASWRYFGLPPHLLSWGEIAMLAVLPNAPSLVFPGKNQSSLLKKRNALLKKLYKNNHLSSLDLQLALAEEIPQSVLDFPKLAPEILSKTKQKLPNGGTETTFIIPIIQRNIKHLLEQQAIFWRQQGIFNAAILVSKLPQGEVVAYHGNLPYENQPNENGHSIDLLQKKRSYGSLLKPFLYAYMLQDGLLLPNAWVTDIPINYGGYRPKNFLKNNQGLVNANQVLAQSLNIPSVNWLQNYRTARFLHQLKKMGITGFSKTAEHYGLSLILGGAELSPWEISGLYGALANKTKGIDFFNLQLTKNHVSRFNFKGVNTAVAWFTSQAISQAARPNADGQWQQFNNIGSSIAWKTGTSFGHRDAWAVGYNASYLVTVWIGNATGMGQPILGGLSVAAPTLFQVFDLLPKPEVEKIPIPINECKIYKVCKTTHWLASEHCPIQIYNYLPDVFHKQTVCKFHQTVGMDSSKNFRVQANCYPLAKTHYEKVLMIPPNIYYFNKKKFEEPCNPPWLSNCEPLGSNRIGIIYPTQNAHVILPTLPDKQASHLVCRASHVSQNATLFWYLNQTLVGTTKGIHQLALQTKSGSYTLRLIDDAGFEKAINIKVTAIAPQ